MFRSAGAHGLVYPSARSDIVCRCEGDNVVEHSGWCFVDYSAFELARLLFRIIIDPILWCAQEPLDIYIKPAGEADAGSWKIVGLTALTERKHLDRVNDWYSKGWAEVMPHLRKKWCQFWR